MEKLNITNFLKDCPQGMKLNCLILDNLYFDKISEDKQSKYPIFCFTIDENGNRNSISFTENGCVTTRYGSKCVIFPEGKTTWEGFQRPFKDGDIVFYNNTIAIFQEWGDETLFRTYFAFYPDVRVIEFSFEVNRPLFGKGVCKEIRFATEEEKQQLFDAIKANGYKWNAETKTLEKLIEPKFKVGDRIRHKTTYKNDVYEIREVYDDAYALVGYTWMIYKEYENQYELIPNKFDISTLKPFDKVLVRADNSFWRIGFFEKIEKKNKHYPFVCMGYNKYSQCIPYEGNEHLLGTTNDCDDYYKTW